ncbi:hypothetical protein H6761_03790 [Candidatus Nomurabacteria bacterium]|nr:hypothetical protein [Candidatus Nomurabacteria bacterium]
MKINKLLWLTILFVAFLTGCATYHGGMNYNEEFCQWKVVADRERVMFSVAEASGNSYVELLPGQSHSFQTPRQDQLRLRVKYWLEIDQYSDEQAITIQRTGRWSGIQEIKLDDFLLNNMPRLEGYFINTYREPIDIVSYRGYSNVGHLEVGQASQALYLSPGPMTIHWKTSRGENHYTKVTIRDDRHKVEFNGKPVDWYVELR